LVPRIVTSGREQLFEREQTVLKPLARVFAFRERAVQVALP
jgi:hypothetical protein